MSADVSLLHDRRGGATFEGVIVSTFLTLVFALLAFQARTAIVDAGIRARVRSDVWTSVARGCGSEGPDREILDFLQDYPARSSDEVPALPPRYDDTAYRSEGAVQSEAVHPPGFGLRARTRTSRLTIDCNERRAVITRGDVDSILRGTWCAVGGRCL